LTSLGTIRISLAALLLSGMSLAFASPSREQFLAWGPDDTIDAFRHIEDVFSTRTVQRGPTVYPLPVSSKQIDVEYFDLREAGTIDDYMERNRVAGLLVVSHGEIVLERYGLGQTAEDRWASFSVAKSITSTLLGAAIRDGHIAGVTDPVTKYVPELKGSAYEGVTIADLLEMRSGVRWDEDYSNPDSDVGRLASAIAHDRDTLVQDMAALPREAAPGSRFLYKTGESDLLGIIVARATGKPLSQYLSEKIWAPFGMERDAVWITTGGTEVGGCCISMTLRDYARFALFFMGNGTVGTEQILPPGWNREATKRYTRSVFDGFGYGYQWWPARDGSYYALGIFGQSIFIDPARQLIVVTLSAWPAAGWEEGNARRDAFLRAVRRATRKR
jgi:CubicO group peptidase (beta-lactamase class C family)